MDDSVTLVPMDPVLDLNEILNKLYDEDDNDRFNMNNNEANMFDLISPYVNVNDLNCKMFKPSTKSNCNSMHTALHINIQSLPAKIDNLKLLIHELHEKHIEVDFILLCETFLTDNNQNHVDIAGYNLVCKNRPNSNRGGVAIYINSKYNFKLREDIAINIPGTFESIFVEITSNNFNGIIGEIYCVPNTSEINSTLPLVAIRLSWAL